MTTVQIVLVEELLTEAQAVSRIPGRDSGVRKWLRGLRIARRGPTGMRLYRLSEILAHLDSAETTIPNEVQQSLTARGLRRSSQI